VTSPRAKSATLQFLAKAYLVACGVVVVGVVEWALWFRTTTPWAPILVHAAVLAYAAGCYVTRAGHDA